MTLQEQLVNVRKAITKAETVQSYKINNREAVRANLETLYKREKELLKKIARYGADYIEGTKKSTRTPFKMVGANVKF
jgi:FixJ family two-component response regulator